MNLFVSSWLHSYIEYKTKSINKQIKHTKKQKKQAYKCRQQNGGSQRRSGWGDEEDKGVEYKVMRGDYTLNGEHTIEYTYVIL